MNKVPNHLGIILDGNRRWAEEKGLRVSDGHYRGMEVVKKIIPEIKKRGVKILTLFVFSVENWKRPRREVDFLMNLIKKTFDREKKGGISEEGIKIKIIGQKNRLLPSVRKIVDKIEMTTEKNKEMVLNIALSYGGRAEITELVKKIIKEGISYRKISEKFIAENLSITNIDLIIRTGKEKRLSNFFIWQAAYSELYFTDKYWPEFTTKELDKALLEYERRQRRFGK